MNVLIPVKSLSAAKSRLAGYLSLEERKKLMLQMLTHVITTIKSCETITQIAIVTPDKSVIQLAKQNGIKILPEEKPGYNEALTYAAQHENEHPLLTIAADLPLVTTQDILHTVLQGARFSSHHHHQSVLVGAVWRLLSDYSLVFLVDNVCH